MNKIYIPRLCIAGISGDSGKTTVSCGLISAIKARNLKLAAFKKGPDYIDTAWLKAAGSEEARNLDTYLMGRNYILHSFFKNSSGKDFALIEGNRGLFDGIDEHGEHSSAELAKLLKAPLILVLPVVKITRSAAALALGCKLFDRDLKIAGIILNFTAGKRHESVVCRSIEDETGIPVVGAIPRLSEKAEIPMRHLGLITPSEHGNIDSRINEMRAAIENYCDIGRILDFASLAQPFEFSEMTGLEQNCTTENKVKIAYFRDRAFSFYYPDNLEALESEGAELVPISSLESRELPEVGGLYIGGGFPETNIEAISKNVTLMRSIKEAVEKGLPVYAECGGLIYLSESINMDGKKYTLAGVLPVETEMHSKPQGHGYAVMNAVEPNPFFKQGTRLVGHEFHYTSVFRETDRTVKCLEVERGCGSIDKKDGYVYKNLFATYLHIHAAGVPKWAGNFVGKAIEYSRSRI